MARTLDDAAYRGLKTATRRLVDATGGIDPASASTRVGRATMAQYYSPADRDEAVYMPLDVIADLERVTGEPLVTRQLARLTGFDLVPAETPLASDRAPGDAGNPVQDSLLLGASLSVRILPRFRLAPFSAPRSAPMAHRAPCPAAAPVAPAGIPRPVTGPSPSCYTA